MAIKCNEPFYADKDPAAPPRTVSAYGVGPTFGAAARMAEQAAIARAQQTGKAWFDAQQCPERCRDKQGGYNHGSDAYALTTIAHIQLLFGFELVIVQASCHWNGVVICRTPSAQG